MICEKCGREFFEDYRKDKDLKRKEPISRFCSRACANSRSFSEEVNLSRKEKNSIASKRVWQTRKELYQVICKCEICGKEWRTPRYKVRKTCSKECCNKLNSIKMIKRLEENPELVPYLLNHASKGPSYPEQYWMDLIRVRNLPFSFHKKIGRFELDFYNDDFKIDLEIDGDQHYVDLNSVERDKRRTEYLEKLGWRVIRIRWSSWLKYSPQEQEEILEEIRRASGEIGETHGAQNSTH